jgi:hypothetical protein
LADSATARFVRDFPEAAGPRRTGEPDTVDYAARTRQREATPADIPELGGAQSAGRDTVLTGLAVADQGTTGQMALPELRGPALWLLSFRRHC